MVSYCSAENSTLSYALNVLEIEAVPSEAASAIAATVKVRPPHTLHHQYRKKGLYIDKFVTLPPEFYKFFVDSHLIPHKTAVFHVGLHQWIANRYDELYRQLEKCVDFNMMPVIHNIMKLCMDLLAPLSNELPYNDHIEQAAKIIAGGINLALHGDMFL